MQVDSDRSGGRRRAFDRRARSSRSRSRLGPRPRAWRCELHPGRTARGGRESKIPGGAPHLNRAVRTVARGRLAAMKGGAYRNHSGLPDRPLLVRNGKLRRPAQSLEPPWPTTAVPARRLGGAGRSTRSTRGARSGARGTLGRAPDAARAMRVDHGVVRHHGRRDRHAGFVVVMADHRRALAPVGRRCLCGHRDLLVLAEPPIVAPSRSGHG